MASEEDDAQTVQRVLVCELGLTNSMGVAMSTITPGAANDATKAGLVAENITGNLGEVSAEASWRAASD